MIEKPLRPPAATRINSDSQTSLIPRDNEWVYKN